MAVIGKIQKNSLLLLIVIGLAMLAFIFTDFLRNGGGEVERLDTATLYGEPIDELKFNELKDLYVTRSQNEYAYQQREWDDAAQKAAEESAFNELVRRTLLKTEFDKLGIVCTTDELNDMIHGNHIHQWVSQIPIFSGAAGFSRDSVRNYISTLENEPLTDDPQVRQQWLDSRKQWKDFENELKEARRTDKYVAMIKKGMFINKLEAKNQYNALYSKKQIKFVVQRYVDIPVEEITLSDDELEAYFNEHKGDSQYEQEEARDIQMVTFPIVPTQEDLDIVKSQLMELEEPFKVAQNDIAFVFQNSDFKLLSDSTVFKMGSDKMTLTQQGGSYPKSADDEIQEAKVGDVVGPYETTSGHLAIAKVLETPTETQAWVRHILISTNTRSEDKAKQISDSLIAVIKAEDNFAQLVPLVSEDPGSIENGGEYKWFGEGVMVPAFNDASFNGAIGQIQLVKTNYGYHIVEVLGRADRITPVLAVVTKEIEPSENTLRDVESRAYDYIYGVSESTADSAFYTIAADSGKFVQSARVYMSNDYVIGMTDSKRMMRFAFNANTIEGDISDPILDGDKYVVALVSNVIEEGEPELADVQDLMRVPALKDKQAKAYMEKMSGKNSLEEVGDLLTNGQLVTSEITFDSKSIVNGGQVESDVIGTLFRAQIPVGSMTHPIQGEEGVYVVIIEGETPAPETSDYESVSGTMEVQRVGGSDNLVLQALIEKADLTDNRRKIEFQR